MVCNPEQPCDGPVLKGKHVNYSWPKDVWIGVILCGVLRIATRYNYPPTARYLACELS